MPSMTRDNSPVVGCVSPFPQVSPMDSLQDMAVAPFSETVSRLDAVLRKNMPSNDVYVLTRNQAISRVTATARFPALAQGAAAILGSIGLENVAAIIRATPGRRERLVNMLAIERLAIAAPDPSPSLANQDLSRSRAASIGPRYPGTL